MKKPAAKSEAKKKSASRAPKTNPRKGWAKQYAEAIRKHGPEKPFWPDNLRPGETELEWTW